MRSLHSRVAGLLTAGLAVLAGGASAQIATFEDVGVDPAVLAAQLSGTYKGFRWTGVALVKATHRALAGCPRCGYRHAHCLAVA